MPSMSTDTAALGGTFPVVLPKSSLSEAAPDAGAVAWHDLPQELPAVADWDSPPPLAAGDEACVARVEELLAWSEALLADEVAVDDDCELVERMESALEELDHLLAADAREQQTRTLVSAVLPVRGDVPELEALVLRLRGDERRVQLILVDDGSHGDTLALLQRWDRQDSGLTVVWQNRPRGRGGALRCALRHALGDVVAVVDPTSGVDLMELSALCNPVLGGCCAAIHGTCCTRHSGTARWRGRVRSWMLRRLTGQSLSDAPVACRVYSRRALAQLTLREAGDRSETEIAVQLARHGGVIYELPLRAAHAGRRSLPEPSVWQTMRLGLRLRSKRR